MAEQHTPSQDRATSSTEQEGDVGARSDTIDRGQPDTADSRGQENVEDRPNVSSVDPDDYPEQQ